MPSNDADGCSIAIGRFARAGSRISLRASIERTENPRAEIFVTTSGGPGNATTNLAFLIYARALLQYDVGGASAGGVVAIVLANVVAFFLVRSIARRLEV